MAKNDSRTGQASSCHEVVAFDFDGMFEVGKETAPYRLPSNLPKPHEPRVCGTSKYRGVYKYTCRVKGNNKQYSYSRWRAQIEINDTTKMSTRKTEIEAAIEFDNWVKEYNLDRTTNYDLYGEYWK